MPEPKDVVIGILGASGALAGLLLVFGGFIFAQAASFPASTDDKITERHWRLGEVLPSCQSNFPEDELKPTVGPKDATA
jgi:hypothetical protein